MSNQKAIEDQGVNVLSSIATLHRKLAERASWIASTNYYSSETDVDFYADRVELTVRFFVAPQKVFKAENRITVRFEDLSKSSDPGMLMRLAAKDLFHYFVLHINSSHDRPA